MSLKALLLDLDGTLAETDSLHMPTWVEVLKPHGIEVDERFYKENISGRLNPDIVEDFLPHLPEEEARSMADRKEAMFRERAGELEPLPGLLYFLEEARKRGLALALVTNAPEENVEALLRGLKLEGNFDPVVMAGDLAAGKPDPEPYRVTLEKLGVPPGDTLAFEDSASGISSATGAGVPTVGIASTHTPEKLRAAGAFAVYEDFTDPGLLELLDR